MANKGQSGAGVERAATGDVESPSAFKRLLLDMQQIATADADPQAYSGADLERILDAETEAEMWDADEIPAINAKMLSGCAIVIYEWSVKYSTDPEINTPFVADDGKKMYLLISSARLDKSGEKAILRLPEPGEVFQWNTSARYIVAKMFWLLKHGYFDSGHTVRARIVGTELSGGRSVEKLKPLDAPAGMTAEPLPSEPPF